MAIYLNERYSGGSHVTAKDEAAVKGAIVGGTSAVIDHGNNLALTVTPGTGGVAIADGVFSFCGRCGWTDGAAETYTKPTGDSVRKKLLIGLEYERNATNNQETISLKVYASEEVLPEDAADATISGVPSETITTSGTKAFFKLWSVIVSASDNETPVCMFDKVKSLAQLTAAVAQEVTDRQNAVSALTETVNSQASSISTETAARTALDGRVQNLEATKTKRYVTGQSITGSGVNIVTTGTPVAFTVGIAWNNNAYQITQVGSPIKLNGASILPAIFELTKKDGVSAEVVKIEISMSTSNGQTTINISSSSSDVLLLGANFIGVSAVS